MEKHMKNFAINFYNRFFWIHCSSSSSLSTTNTLPFKNSNIDDTHSNIKTHAHTHTLIYYQLIQANKTKFHVKTKYEKKRKFPNYQISYPDTHKYKTRPVSKKIVNQR